MTTELGTVIKVDPQEVFTEGNDPLSEWLTQHLEVVGDALEMDLAPVGDDRNAGGNVVAHDAVRDRIVIICSQVSPSDESQLGRLLTLAGDNSANAVVWVGPELRQSHRQALEWFNRQSGDNGIKFYALGLELFRVDDSKPGVVLRLLATPIEHFDSAVAGPSTRGILSGGAMIGVVGANGHAKAPEVPPRVTQESAAGVAPAVSQEEPSSEPHPGAAAQNQAAAAPPVASGAQPGNGAGHEETPAPAPAPSAEAAPGGDQQESYRRFFQRMVEELHKFGVIEAKPSLAQNWYSLPSTISGIIYSILFASNGRIRAELYIDLGDRNVNQEIYARLHTSAAEMQKESGAKLEWDPNQGGRACSVSTSVPGTISDPPEVLEKNLTWAVGRLVSFREVFGRRLPAIIRSLPPRPAPQKHSPAPNR
jgi:hypothetical protein